MNRIAVISAILDNPEHSQKLFNEIVAEHKDLVRGRMGLPLEKADIAVISIVVSGSLDRINAFTGQLGKLSDVTVKTAISPKEIAEL